MAEGKNGKYTKYSQENCVNDDESSCDSNYGESNVVLDGNTVRSNEKSDNSNLPQPVTNKTKDYLINCDITSSKSKGSFLSDNGDEISFPNLKHVLKQMPNVKVEIEEVTDERDCKESPARVQNPVNNDGGLRPNCDEFPVDVIVVRDCKSESDVLNSEYYVNKEGEENADDDENCKLLDSSNMPDTSPPERPRQRKNGRSRSWCARSGEDGLSVADIRLLRERLLRTQSHPQPTAIRGFSRTQRATLVSLALVDFMSFCSMSIMAPFFPREASEKGLTDSVSGFVFSFYALVMFVTSPFFGKIIPTVGAKFLLLSGIFLAGSCNLLFGCLEYIHDYATFTTFCFVIRGLEAVGASAYSTASYVFVVNTFPNNIGSVLGILETFIGLGMSAGPAIGGILYSVGGFGLPFYVLGIAMVITMPINWMLLPNQEDCSVSSQSGSLLELVKVPAVVITGLVIVVVSNTWAFLDPTLEPHLRQFDLSAEQVGLIFLLFSGLYGIFSPVWGYLADRINRHWCMMVWGLLFCTVGLLILGPSPLLPFLKSSLWLNLVGLSIIGISVALTLLPTFQGVLTSSIEEGGCGDNLATYSIVAGVWSCMYSLGEVIGPSLGGVLLRNFGFPICSTVMAALTFVLALVTLTFFSLKEASKMSAGGSDSFSDSVRTGGFLASPETPAEDQPLLSSGSSGSSGSRPPPRRVRQSYGGTGVSTKHGHELNQNQQNTTNTDAATDHFKLKYLFQSNPKPAIDNNRETDLDSEDSVTIEGLRALIQSDFYQKYLNQSFNAIEGNGDKAQPLGRSENPFVFQLPEEVQFKKNDSGLFPRLSDLAAKQLDKGFVLHSQNDLLRYNKDKVKYYSQSRQQDSDGAILDRHQVTDVRGTVNITSSGACEV